MERPILFSAPMVKALLEGRKTQTRRIVKPQGPMQPGCWDNCVVSLTDGHSGRGWYAWDEGYEDEGSFMMTCPYGKPGDRLWVREAWGTTIEFDGVAPCNLPPDVAKDRIFYAADGPVHGRKRPAMFMPRKFSRLTLEITNMRVQRVEEISEEDAAAEGFLCRGQFLELFYNVNKRAAPWSNPWVWALTFKVTSHA